jgi:S-adenosylmethionine:tRNA ribosyltransferase-isomerase
MNSRFDARELDYELPDDRIAQAPLPERDAARLLCLAEGGAIAHRSVRDLPELLAPSLIVVNDTRVIPARLFGHKPSGGKVELLLYERLSPPGARERWLALGKASKGLREGDHVAIGDGAMSAQVVGARERSIEVELCAEPDVTTALARIGQVPLPPYIRRAPDASDAERYQTVFAANDGAVAAPTAGLHLSATLIAALRARGHELAFVTLHVGPGTFAPLRGDDLAEHAMHPERYVVPFATAVAIARAREDGRQVLAVGTTVVRTLEAAALEDRTVRHGSGATALFIYPPYRFRVVDALLTNFHLPRSTLLALVMAFGGIEAVRNAYRLAVDSGYRFYSYGDAMLIGGTA